MPVAGDIFSVGADIIRLLRAREVDAAIQRVNDRLALASAERFASTVLVIKEISLCIKATEAERQRILEEVEKFPSDERRQVALELKNLVDRLFSDEIARLRSEKRRRSRGL